MTLVNRAEQQMRERIAQWLKNEDASSLYDIADTLYRFEVFLGECEERRQRA
jgi:hypothetical protein